MDEKLFKNNQDYWMVADNIRDIYMSENSLANLMDFERVLDELDIYAFKNWDLGELVDGPDIGKYTVACTFLWPEKLMPDPRGGARLLPFDCDVKYKKTKMTIPVKISQPADFRPGTHKAKLVEKNIWLVEIVIPKHLMNDIKTGHVELLDQTIDLEELDQAYDQDLDTQQYQSVATAQQSQEQMQAPTPGGPPSAPAV